MTLPLSLTMMPRIPTTGLYALVDVDATVARGRSVIEFARSVLSVRPPLLQLRAKTLGARDTLALLRQLRRLSREAGALLFANDRPDLAVLAECDGVHLGQQDLSVQDARQIGPGLLIGVSTHNPDQLVDAVAEKPDYVAYGPVFETHSKERPDRLVGLDGLRWAKGLASEHHLPLVGIGGIDLERAASLANLRVVGAAIAALLPADTHRESVEDRTLAIKRALEGSD